MYFSYLRTVYGLQKRCQLNRQHNFDNVEKHDKLLKYLRTCSTQKAKCIEELAML